jgi:hypothetical protein
MEMKHAFIVLLCALAVGCNHTPQLQPLPPQRVSGSAVQPDSVGSFVAMNHPRAELYFAGDVSKSLEGNVWRWAGKKPTLRFRLPSTENLSFTADFTVPELTFRDTGAVTISFVVNGHALDTVRYDTPGEKHFEKAVPAEWLRSDAENLVSAEIDKLWISKANGATYGFILIRAGFID